MPGQIPIIERAFQLAGSGQFDGPGQIAAYLAREGYLDVEDHFQAPLLRRQLRETCRGRACHGSDERGTRDERTVSSSGMSLPTPSAIHALAPAQ